MEAIVHDYFKGLFTSKAPNKSEIDEVLQSLAPRMTEEASHRLSQPFTAKEVTDAISSMSPLKSPGPNGFPAVLYQNY